MVIVWSWRGLTPPPSNPIDSSSDAENSSSSEEYEVRELWDASSSEEENFDNAEGADEDGHWQVNIIGEEVDGLGEVRYEAAWERWTRADGTNTTWNNDLLHPADIAAWKRKQTIKRKELAAESLDIDIWSTLDVHNTASRLRAQAYDEKLKLRERSPLKLREQMERLLAEKRAMDEDPPASPSDRRSSRHLTRDTSVSASASYSQTSPAFGSSRAHASPSYTSESRTSSSRLSKQTTAPASTSSSRNLKRSATAFSTASSSTLISSSTSTSAKGKQRVIESPISRSPTPIDLEAEPRPTRPLPSRARRSPIKLSKRKKLEREWTTRAHTCGAAAITITNDIDDDEIPSLPPQFRYLESEYRHSDGIPEIRSAGFFLSCECKKCTDATLCSCQEPSDWGDAHGEKTFAYTSDGLFRFNVPQGVEVIECNKYCRCDRLRCQNRVAQQPRDVPVEVFKTDDRGWGVKSPVDIGRGKVLGIYTGLLIRRDAAEALSEEATSYCFDLDGRENPYSDTPGELYSVNSQACGNWTRFINHSCSPNLQVYLVVYDRIPDMNIPYIAFVATANIPAGTEFTVDYDPAAAVTTKGKGKAKAKPVIPAGAAPCRCGSARCRGWVRV